MPPHPDPLPRGGEGIAPARLFRFRASNFLRISNLEFRIIFLSLLFLSLPAFSAVLQNTDFDVSDTQSPRFGWAAPFSVSITNGQAAIAEDGVHLPVRLTQQFDLGTNVTQIQIILEALNLGTNAAGQPPDAFQISLLDTNSASLVPVTGQAGTTAFFSAQQDGRVYYGSSTAVPGAAGSGTNWTPAFPVVITLNLTNLTSNVAAVLSFDLLGFDRVASSVVVSRIRMIGLEPAGAADTVVMNEDSGAAIAILTNDVAGAGQALEAASLRVITQPANGAITSITTNGVVSYQPATNYNGPDSFSYTIADFAGNRSATTTVSITVSPVNDAPVLDDTKAPALAAVDEDPGVPSGAVGTLVSALVDFSVPAGGLDNVTDADSGAVPGVAILGKTAAGQLWYSTNNGTSWAQVPAVSAASALLLAADAQARLYYQPATNFNGGVSDVVTFAAWDRSAGASGATSANASTRGGATAFSEKTDAAAITVNSVNDVPVVTNDTYSMAEDGVLNGASVLANDSDLQGGAPGENNTPLTAVLVGNTLSGLLTLNADGTFTYRPNTNFNGTDTFRYRAVDSLNGTSALATVTITVTSVNDAPAVANDIYVVVEDGVLGAFTVLSNDSDLQGSAPGENNLPLTALLVTSTTNGQLTFNTDGTFTYRPNTNFNGTDGFTYRAKDNLNATSALATVTITVNSGNDVPVVTNDTYNVAEDTLLGGGNVLANDSDLHGGAPGENNTPLTVVLVATTPNGQLTLNADGTFNYRPNTNFNGTDTFTYRAKDSLNGTSAVATVTINVSAVNDPPSITTPGTTNVFRMTASALRGIVLADVDAGAGNLTLALSVKSGTLQLATNVAGGVTAAQVISNGQANVYVTAPLAALNATLAATNGLIYTSGFNYTGSETLALDLNDNGNSGSGGAKSMTGGMGITVTGDAKDAWRQANFSINALTDPAKEATVWGDAADPDADGQHNLMEFVADTNPNSAVSRLQFWVEFLAGSPARYRLHVTPGVAGRTYTVLGSPTATTGFAPLASPTVQTNGAERLITDTPPAGTNVRFYRLKISLP